MILRVDDPQPIDPHVTPTRFRGCPSCGWCERLGAACPDHANPIMDERVLAKRLDAALADRKRG